MWTEDFMWTENFLRFANEATFLAACDAAGWPRGPDDKPMPPDGAALQEVNGQQGRHTEQAQQAPGMGESHVHGSTAPDGSASSCRAWGKGMPEGTRAMATPCRWQASFQRAKCLV